MQQDIFKVILLNICSMKEGEIWKREFQTTQAVFWRFSSLQNNDWRVGRKPAVALWYCPPSHAFESMPTKEEKAWGGGRKGFNKKRWGGGLSESIFLAFLFKWNLKPNYFCFERKFRSVYHNLNVLKWHFYKRVNCYCCWWKEQHGHILSFKTELKKISTRENL